MASVPQPQEFQVAVICALGPESNAIQGIFDEIYEAKDLTWQKAPDDRNAYTLGRIGRHNVVQAHMAGMGKVVASVTARDIRATFPNISRGLTLVAGVCGGAPNTAEGSEIFLGDILISTEIQQADFGREHPSGFVMKAHSESNLGSAPSEIKAFLHKLSSRGSMLKLKQRTALHAGELSIRLDIEPPELSTDKLFPASYLHKHQKSAQQRCQACALDETSICSFSQNATCNQLFCAATSTRFRQPERSAQHPEIHFGPICSTDTVKRTGTSRDNYVNQHKALGFEMEGAGVWNTLPTIVVKAVCDYADSHKNKKWQEFAAINAAACCKALIEEWIPLALTSTPQSNDILQAEDCFLARKEYLASLQFAQLNSRLHDIKYAQGGTCSWIFESAEFKSWLNPLEVKRHHGVLWLKGGPGSGKSVLMKHIYQSHRLWEGYTVAGYFFNARGNVLQQTLNGLLRAILIKLMSRNSQLLDRFISEYNDSGQGIKDRIWANSELQDFLFRAIRNAWLTNTVLMIDALDECEISDARELVSLCEDLALEAMQSKTRLLICFSIRHFPTISMKHCQQLIVDNRKEHDADIQIYASRKLIAQELLPEVLRKAQHIFLWVVLVIQILNAYHDRGSDIATMHNILSKIPPGLQAVFDLLLQQNPESQDETACILQLVLYSRSALSLRTLYTLLVAITKPDWQRLVLDRTLGNDALRLFIVSTSRGLLQLTDTRMDSLLPADSSSPKPFTFTSPTSIPRYLEKASHPGATGSIVQFIHESVADYLRESRRVQQESSPISRSAGACHALIAESCLKILKSGLSVESLNTKTFPSATKLFGARAVAEAYVYAEANLLDHMLEVDDSIQLDRLLKSCLSWFASQSGRPIDDLLDRLVMHEPQNKSNKNSRRKPMGSSLDIKLETMLKRVIGIDHSGSFEYAKVNAGDPPEIDGHDDFSVTVSNESPESVSEELSSYYDTNANDQFELSKHRQPKTSDSLSGSSRYSEACFNSYLRGWQNALEILVEGGAQISGQSSKIIDLIGRNLYIVLHPHLGFTASDAGKKQQMLLLFFSAIAEDTLPFREDSEYFTGWTPVVAASENCNVAVLKALLALGADPDAVDVVGGCALGYAIAEGYIDVVKELISSRVSTAHWPIGHRVSAYNSEVVSMSADSTPLDYALQCGHEDIVQLLLMSQAF